MPSHETTRRAETTLARPLREPPERSRLKIRSWRPYRKGALRGFLVVELPAGLVISDCLLMCNAGSQFWIALPMKAALDGDRRQKLGADGKAAYIPIVQWRNRNLADAFSAAAIDVLRRDFPQALAGGGMESPWGMSHEVARSCR
jgi:hypothetical protein